MFLWFFCVGVVVVVAAAVAAVLLAAVVVVLIVVVAVVAGVGRELAVGLDFLLLYGVYFVLLGLKLCIWVVF